MDVVHRMNDEYKELGELKSVLSNRGLRTNAKKCLYEGVILLYQRPWYGGWDGIGGMRRTGAGLSKRL